MTLLRLIQNELLAARVEGLKSKLQERSNQQIKRWKQVTKLLVSPVNQPQKILPIVAPHIYHSVWISHRQ